MPTLFMVYSKGRKLSVFLKSLQNLSTRLLKSQAAMQTKSGVLGKWSESVVLAINFPGEL